jgi:hypothetical protein
MRRDADGIHRVSGAKRGWSLNRGQGKRLVA